MQEGSIDWLPPVHAQTRYHILLDWELHMPSLHQELEPAPWVHALTGIEPATFQLQDASTN